MINRGKDVRRACDAMLVGLGQSDSAESLMSNTQWRYWVTTQLRSLACAVDNPSKGKAKSGEPTSDWIGKREREHHG